jgi:hypothetical protein
VTSEEFRGGSIITPSERRDARARFRGTTARVVIGLLLDWEVSVSNGVNPRAIESLRDRFRVDLNVEVEPARLAVETALTNGTSETVHVFNVLWDYAPSGAIVGPESPAYVCIQDGQLRLARRTLPIPGKVIYVAIDAYATPLQAGGVLKEKMSFEVPVQEYSCYFRREDDSPVEAVESSTARFEYGVAIGAKEGAFAPAPLPGALRLVNPTKIEGVLLVQSRAVACRTQVMRRRDAFERF